MSDTNIRNTIYEDIMYNTEIKEEYLTGVSEKQDTRNTYKRIFLKSYMLEKMWEKDLCEFNLNEIEQLLTALSPLTPLASKSNASMVNSYINWSFGKYNSRLTNVSPIETLKNNQEWLGKFINKEIELYISKQEIDNLANKETGCKNYQDSAIFYALFEGINQHQLAQIKKTDLNDNNIIRLRNDKGEFDKDVEGNDLTIEVSDKCMQLLKNAAEEKFYHVNNGEETKARFDTVNLVDNEYVIRLGNTRNKAPMEPVKHHVISRRVKNIAELIGNPYLTPKNIIKSGHIYEGYLLWDKAGRPNYPDGKLTTEQYQHICKKFNFPKQKSGENSYYYNTNTLRQYVSLEQFKKYYS